MAALTLSHLFAARTALALPVSLAGPEYLLVLAIIVVGVVLATIPAALGYRHSIAASLRS